MEEADKDWMMIRMVGWWMFLLVPAHPDSPGQRAVKWLLCTWASDLYPLQHYTITILTRAQCYLLQASAVAEKPTRCAASQRTCCKQISWMLSVINLRPKLTMLDVKSRQFAATTRAFNLPHLHLVAPLGVTPFEFCQDFRHQKTRFP